MLGCVKPASNQRKCHERIEVGCRVTHLGDVALLQRFWRPDVRAHRNDGILHPEIYQDLERLMQVC
jgi:hypothetical protein